jgi:hypothetical protein
MNLSHLKFRSGYFCLASFITSSRV